ncbi:MAG: type II toxin-antitoxin system VapC family toxin [Parvibaculaceae bacterium]
MFVDASAIVAVMTREPETERIDSVLRRAGRLITSPVVVLEVALALARPDKLNRPVCELEPFILDFLEERGIDLVDLPEARHTTKFALSAADRFRKGRRGLNLGDCLHYACAKLNRVPILATGNEFRQTDLDVVS